MKLTPGKYFRKNMDSLMVCMRYIIFGISFPGKIIFVLYVAEQEKKIILKFVPLIVSLQVT